MHRQSLRFSSARVFFRCAMEYRKVDEQGGKRVEGGAASGAREPAGKIPDDGNECFAQPQTSAAPSAACPPALTSSLPPPPALTMMGDEDFRSTKYSIDKMIGSGAFSVVWYALAVCAHLRASYVSPGKRPSVAPVNKSPSRRCRPSSAPSTTRSTRCARSSSSATSATRTYASARVPRSHAAHNLWADTSPPHLASPCAFFFL